MAFMGLTEGRLVHYVLTEGPSKGQHRPALVVKVWREGEASYPPHDGTVQLAVFMDGTNDYAYTTKDIDPLYGQMIQWKTSVLFDDKTFAPGTWHGVEASTLIAGEP